MVYQLTDTEHQVYSPNKQKSTIIFKNATPFIKTLPTKFAILKIAA
jgi:hypothetical protein